jgi:hypothetical protein
MEMAMIVFPDNRLETRDPVQLRWIKDRERKVAGRTERSFWKGLGRKVSADGCSAQVADCLVLRHFGGGRLCREIWTFLLSRSRAERTADVAREHRFVHTYFVLH